ncbi:MAG TPA: antitoxin Xre-like helix-turn-helix domain-containing protein [Rhizomicrobium sp.]|jgi:uncharacterized protein (DUF2384 family)
MTKSYKTSVTLSTVGRVNSGTLPTGNEVLEAAEHLGAPEISSEAVVQPLGLNLDLSSDDATFRVRRRGMASRRTAVFEAQAGLQTFANADSRARLSATAAKAFVRLAKHWQLSNAEAAALLGVSQSTWDRMKRGERTEALSQDQLTRVSALSGTFKALHLLFADAMADRWPRLPNKGPLFENRRPIDAMIDGGIPHMLEVRRYVDAVRGGL